MLDLMTLILVFFIILYADLLMQNPLNKVVQTAAIEVRSTSGQQPSINPGSVTAEKSNPKYMYYPEKKNAVSAVERKIHEVMGNADLSNYTVKTSGNRTILTIGENISFPVGQAQLLEHIKPALRKMALFLNQEKSFRIIVSGHTDNTPIHTPKFLSNWELSVARALSVAKFLISADIAPSRVSVEGFGQYRPIEDNDYFEGRKANRRVEISLISQ